jgi:hypothetical protein
VFLIRPIKERDLKETTCKNKNKNPFARNKRWVVEKTNSCHHRFRKLLIRFVKKVENYLGLIQI